MERTAIGFIKPCSSVLATGIVAKVSCPKTQLSSLDCLADTQGSLATPHVQARSISALDHHHHNHRHLGDLALRLARLWPVYRMARRVFKDMHKYN